MSHAHVAATVAGLDVPIADVDAREAVLRDAMPAAALPRPNTSEGRQLRRWLTQLLVTERVIAAEAAAVGLTGDGAPTEDALLPNNSARLEIGSVAAAALADPLARAMYAHVTAAVEVTDADVADYHARNPLRFAASSDDREWLAHIDGRSSAAGHCPTVDCRASARRCPTPCVSIMARLAARRAGSARARLRASR